MSTTSPPVQLRSLTARAESAAVPHLREQAAWSLTGVPLLTMGVAAMLTGVWLALRATQDHGGALGGAGMPAALVLIGSIALRGLASVAPGQTLVLQVFGRYTGSLRTNGLHWINP